jgi:uncharacterized membrane protein
MKDLWPRLVVVVVAAGVVALASTLCKDQAQTLTGLAGVLIGWVIPWFQGQGKP